MSKSTSVKLQRSEGSVLRMFPFSVGVNIEAKRMRHKRGFVD